MALPNNSTIYRTQNWENEYKRTRFGSADDLTKRQERQFNRFAKSKKGEAARLAYDKAETERFNNSVDSALAARKAGMQKAASDFTATLASKAAAAAPAQVAPAQVAPETPALVLKNAAHWNQVAGQYGFKDYNAVAAWQKENGLEADGKFGSASYAKWAQLNPDKVGSAPVIKPRVATSQTSQTPQTSVTPTTDQTAPLVPEGYVELSRPDGTTFFQKSNNSATTPTTPSTQVATPKFNLDTFASTNNLTDFRNFNGKRVVRYDPMGRGDWFIDEEGKTYRADGIGGTLGEFVESNSTKYIPEVQRRFDKLQGMITASYQKQGGTMNRINYFQQGGAAPQQDMQQQVIALVQAAMQGDQKATETVNKIMEAAKSGDQQAMQIAQMIQQVAQKMQGQATAAKWGSKLNYIKSLKYAKGGKTCPACEKKVEMKACGGKKATKK